jgi:opacity protein-like surface antigen
MIFPWLLWIEAHLMFKKDLTQRGCDMKKIQVLGVFLVSVLLMAVPVGAGNWYLGGGLEYVDIGSELGDVVDSGTGLGFNFGYRFTPVFALDFLLSGSRHDDVDSDSLSYGRFTVAPLFYLVTKGSWQPYLTVGIGGHALDWDDFAIEAEGSSFFGGVGFDYFFNPRHSLDVGLRYHQWDADLSLSGIKVGTSDATTTTVNIFYNYHFVK